MKGTLRLGSDLAVPHDFATEGVAVIGMRGSGKTNTEVRWCEELYDAQIPFTVIDPKGDWDGIRSSADGKRPGLSVPVFGGLNGDAPLTRDLGKRIAHMLVDLNISAVLDVSRLSIKDRAHFIAEFCNELMDLHQRDRHVRCVILEEAHRYIPQVIPPELRVVKEAASSLLLEGRAFGLGCWAATQRPARLHKDVLEEVGTAIIHRIGVAATNDLKTIRKWVEHEDLGSEIGASLTKLAAGEAWVLAPSTLGIAQRVQIDRRRTYDSAATPLVGAASRAAVKMAEIDMGAINEALADAIEKAKANDPAELQRRVREMQRALDGADNASAKEIVTLERRIEQLERELEAERACPPVVALPEGLDEAVVHALTLVDSAVDVLKGASKLMDRKALLDAAAKLRREAPAPAPAKRVASPPKGTEPSPVRSAEAPPAILAPQGGSASLSGPERKLLTVLAQYGPRSKRQLAMLAGYVMTGGAFRNPLGRLRSLDFVTKGDSHIELTPAGSAALGDYEPLPSGDALLQHWLNSCTGPERKLLQAVYDRWPKSYTKEELAEATDYEPSGGAFRNPLGKLRTLELVTKGDEITLTDDFAGALGV